MRSRMTTCVFVAVLGSLLAVGNQAQARGGWADPPGGWDIIFDGNYPDLAAMQADSWYNSTTSGDPTTDNDYTTWDWDLTDTVFLSITGEGEIENGAPSADALVFQVRDNDTAGVGVVRRFKVGKPFEGDYTDKADDLLTRNGGVTIVARLRVVVQDPEFPFDEPDAGNRCYRSDAAFGIDGAQGVSGTAGLGVGPDVARWCRDDQTPSTNVETGDLTTTFHTFYAIIEPQSQGNTDNYAGTLWMDGSLTPVAPKMEGPGHTGNDGIAGTGDANENPDYNWYTQSDRFAVGTYPELAGKAMAYFGPGRSGAMITIQYDYICWKVGAHQPAAEGPPAAPANLIATLQGNDVRLAWDDVAGEEGYKIERKVATDPDFTEIGQVGANVRAFVDDTVAPTTDYVYRVRGFNASGDGPYSNEATITSSSGLGSRYWELYNR